MTESELLDCEEVLRVMLAYVDGELAGEAHAQVEAHLERCRSCFSRAEFERHLKAHVAELASQPVSPEFEQRIRRLVSGFGSPDPGGDPKPTA